MKLGSILRITFYDHSGMDGDVGFEPMVFETFGRLMEESKVHYRIATWITPGAILDPNAEYFNIIKGAVLDVKVLIEA